MYDELVEKYSNHINHYSSEVKELSEKNLQSQAKMSEIQNEFSQSSLEQ